MCFAVYPAEAAVRAMRPNLPALARLTLRDGNGAIITAIAADSAQSYDYVSRYVSPGHGIPGDAVIGTAHSAPGLYWGPSWATGAHWAPGVRAERVGAHRR